MRRKRFAPAPAVLCFMLVVCHALFCRSTMIDAFLLVSSSSALYHPHSVNHHRGGRRSSLSIVMRRWMMGLPQWREQFENAGVEDREILMLPFRANEGLVPGQMISIVLKEGRFFDLLQDCMDQHCSILGMALMGDDNVLDTAVLCEIIDYNVDAGFRGKVTIQVTMRAVGRATVKEITQMKPVFVAMGHELVDDDHSSSSSSPSSSEGLLQDIRSAVQALGRQAEFEEACQSVRDAATGLVDDDDGACDDDELDVTSWAVFAISLDKSQVAEALASTNAVERLRLGLKVLLGETFNMSGSEPSTAQTDGDPSASDGYK